MASHNRRVIRVFISSTFKDMEEERNELVKFIFPQLKALCEERHVVWGEVDLRWGISSEQKAEGQVLPICLQEIHECRPYFIGLLGERYGWIPDEIAPELIDREPWLKEHLEHSVTELEILHGVLRNPGMARHAFFYFRDKSYPETLSSDHQRESFEEHPLREDIEKYGPGKARELAEMRRGKLAALKNKIRRSGYPVREDYPNPKELGKLVLEDFIRVINDTFPPEEVPDLLQHETILHESYAESFTGVYIPRENYFEALDNHADSEGLPLVVTGDSGLGKTALLANWALNHRSRNPGKFMLLHFIGSSNISANWILMLMRLMGELGRKFDLNLEIPAEPEKLITAFAVCLQRCAAKGRVIIILDAMNQLEDRDRALELHWLPRIIPPNIRLIISANEGKSLDSLAERKWDFLNIYAMNDQEKRQLISLYLAQYSKTLDEELYRAIIASPQTGNPLYLVSLLEELRIYGDYATLTNKTEFYLSATTVESLYDLLLERYEHDYETDREFLVRDAFTFLYTARQGLSEKELLELLGNEGNPLPQRHWISLFLAARRSVIVKSGLMSLSHQYFKKAIEKRYLDNPREKKNLHLELARYFSGQQTGYRKIEELPWHLMQAEEWSSLVDLMKDIQFLTASWESNNYDIKTCWASIEKNSSFRMNDVYKDYTRSQDNYPWQDSWQVGIVLSEAGYHLETLRIIENLVGLPEITDNPALFLECLKIKGHSLHSLGRNEEALKIYHEIRQLASGHNHDKAYASALGDIANMMVLLGNSQEALEYYKEQEEFYRSRGMEEELTGSMANLAVVLYETGRWDEALKLYNEVESRYLRSGSQEGYMMAVGNMALIYKNRGQLDKAVELFDKEETIATELGDHTHLMAAINNKALVLIRWNRLTEAMDMFKRMEKIARVKNDLHSIHKSLGNQAIVLKRLKKFNEAMFLLKEEERYCRHLRNTHDLATCLYNQAVILSELNRPDDARQLLVQAKKLYQETEDIKGTQLVLGEQAEIFYQEGKYKEALALLDEKERIVIRLGFVDSIAMTWMKKALNFIELGALDEARDLILKACAMAEEYGLEDRKEVFNNYRTIIDMIINNKNNTEPLI